MTFAWRLWANDHLNLLCVMTLWETHFCGHFQYRCSGLPSNFLNFHVLQNFANNLRNDRVLLKVCLSFNFNFSTWLKTIMREMIITCGESGRNLCLEFWTPKKNSAWNSVSRSSYSVNLAPSNFWLFPTMKIMLKKKRFDSSPFN